MDWLIGCLIEIDGWMDGLIDWLPVAVEVIDWLPYRLVDRLVVRMIALASRPQPKFLQSLDHTLCELIGSRVSRILRELRRHLLYQDRSACYREPLRAFWNPRENEPGDPNLEKIRFEIVGDLLALFLTIIKKREGPKAPYTYSYSQNTPPCAWAPVECF